MVWHVTGFVPSNELLIEADIPGRNQAFMSASNLTKHRGSAKKVAGQACADAYVRYAATFDFGMALEAHKPGALAWLEERKPWHAEPLYDDQKRGQTILPGKARLVLKDKATALLFKLTWG